VSSGARPLAVISGGSRGIGRALALALARTGHDLVLLARDAEALGRTVEEIRGEGAIVDGIAVDVGDDASRSRVADAVARRGGHLEVLVHSAGTTIRGTIGEASLDDLDEQYRSNVRAPFALTRDLLGSIRVASGQVVFVNSTAALVARASAGQYAATQAALRALADSLRAEVNAANVRVTTVFVGRSASRRQEEVHRFEGRAYRPERLLQPEDVAAIVVAALSLPRTAEVTEMTIRNMIDVRVEPETP
jgi:short-subunit dehydrogenase